MTDSAHSDVRKLPVAKYVAIIGNTTIASRGTRGEALDAALDHFGKARAHIQRSNEVENSVKRYYIDSGGVEEVIFFVGRAEDVLDYTDPTTEWELRSMDAPEDQVEAYAETTLEQVQYDAETEEIEVLGARVKRKNFDDLAELILRAVNNDIEDTSESVGDISLYGDLTNKLYPCRYCGAAVGIEDDEVRFISSPDKNLIAFCEGCGMAAVERLREYTHNNPAKMLGDAI